MAKHIVKCKYCGKQFDTNVEPAVKVSARRYAHKVCADEFEASKTQEQKDEEAFFKYVQNLFGDNYNYMATKKMAQRYIKEYEYTYSGMLKSLIWFYEVKHNSIEKSNGTIGIIPYIYSQARGYYYSLYLAKMANENKEIVDYIPKIKIIQIESPRVYVKPHKLFKLEDEEGE